MAEERIYLCPCININPHISDMLLESCAVANRQWTQEFILLAISCKNCYTMLFL